MDSRVGRGGDGNIVFLRNEDRVRGRIDRGGGYKVEVVRIHEEVNKGVKVFVGEVVDKEVDSEISDEQDVGNSGRD